MPIYCKLLTMCFVFNDLIIIQLSYIRAFTHKLPWLDQYRLILCYNRQLTIIAGGYGFTGIKQERLPFWATFPVCGSYFISESDNLYLKNQIISFFTFFFSSEFSLISNFS